MVHQPPNLPADTPQSEGMVLLCTKLKGQRWVSSYLSPLDAVLGSKGLHRDDTFFWPLDFQRVNTSAFIRENQGWLNVSVSYAFAADRGRLLVNGDGHPLMVVTGGRFPIPDTGSQFAIRFSDNAVKQINAVYVRAGLPRFAATIKGMESWDTERLAEAEQEALDSMPPTLSWADSSRPSLAQCAIYDPEVGEWLFVDV